VHIFSYFAVINSFGLEHLLFAAYLILFAWLVTRIPFFRTSGLTSTQLTILFLIKVMAGIFYGWIGVYYGQLAQMVDTWAYHYESIKEHQLLINDPGSFFSTIFTSNYEQGYGGFLTSQNSWWNDLHGTLFIKMLALFDVLSFQNYYINVIFYSFITLFGAVALFRLMRHVFPNKKLEVLLASFLLPSYIYWTSGIHKDGIIFLGFMLIVYSSYFGLKKRSFTAGKILLILTGFLILLCFRNYLLFLIIPALAAWAISEQVKLKPAYVFLGIYAVFILLFFGIKYIWPSLDFPAAVVEKQHEFLKLKGGSFVPVKELQPNFIFFLNNAPFALTLSTIRPYPSDVHHLLSLAAAVEINFFLILFIIFLFWRKNGVGFTPFILFCLFFSFTSLLTIGYTVSFLGAIVRYRSIFLPFLIIPLVAKIDWQKIGVLIFGDIKNKYN
jgi:hypothetical protein